MSHNPYKPEKRKPKPVPLNIPVVNLFGGNVTRTKKKAQTRLPPFPLVPSATQQVKKERKNGKSASRRGSVSTQKSNSAFAPPPPLNSRATKPPMVGDNFPGHFGEFGNPTPQQMGIPDGSGHPSMGPSGEFGAGGGGGYGNKYSEFRRRPNYPQSNSEASGSEKEDDGDESPR